jgi:drug/metabolite transporter (DMT)-like permease
LHRLIAFLRSAAAAYVLLPLAAACWAGNHIVARAIGGYVPPASLSLLRWLLVALLIAVCAGRHVVRDLPLLGQRLGLMLFLALVGGSIFGTMQYATSLLGEKLYPYHVVGFVLILAGVTLAARPNVKLARAD